jgi:hypothetical protein
VLLEAFRVSSQTTSMRPFGATAMGPNQCHFWGLAGSSLIRRGALKDTPPSVLLTNMTSLAWKPSFGLTLASI